MRNTISDYFQQLQDQICAAIEQTDGKGKFHEDLWQHHGGGGGRTRLIQAGNILEKGGVNFSAVQGQTSEALMKQMNLTERADYFATGVSIVMHPVSPMVPIIHMNVRYFEMSNGTSWFGGGIDLTPHYVVDEDARWFHQQLKATCDAHDVNYYPKFKNWADDYFFLPHRQETRGVGGIFSNRRFHTLISNNQPSLKRELEQHADQESLNVYRRNHLELGHRNGVYRFDPSRHRHQKSRQERHVYQRHCADLL